MDSNLLKEAIADAKAVRQTALANAKVALEEAFSERYHAMFAEKLKEDAGMMGDVAHQPEESKAEENVTEQEIDELIKELEAEVGGEEAAAAPQGEEVPAAPAVPPAPVVPGAVPPGCPPVPPMAGGVAPVAPIGAPVPPMAPSVPPMEPAAGAGAPAPVTPPSDVPPAAGEETDEDVNLDELLESLKAEIEGAGKKLDEKKELSSSGIAPGGNKKPSASASSSSDIESGGVTDHGVPGGKVTSHGDDATEVTKPDHNFDGNKDGNLAKTPSIKEGIGLKDKGVPGGKQTSGEDPTDVTKPDKNFDGNKDGEMAKNSPLKEENDSLKKQLNEAEEVIKYVKTQLNEVNLLNAKLLYTNKLFKEYNMNNEQKMRIVEMFDLAKNVREVKLTYANIAESLNFGGTEKKAPKKAPASVQAITESLASAPVGSTKPSKEIITEGVKFAARMKQLAGIRSEVKK